MITHLLSPAVTGFHVNIFLKFIHTVTAVLLTEEKAGLKIHEICHNKFTTNPCSKRHNQVVAHCNTILSRILRFVPGHEFQTFAKQHHSGRAFRRASRWSKLVGLTMAQLSGGNSLLITIFFIDIFPQIVSG